MKSEFETTIKYTFKNKELLNTALTHSSYANEAKHRMAYNERLEFLGDSVLSLIVSNYLFNLEKHMPEGELTKLRATLVCEKTLAVFANEIGLGSHMLLGKGEENTGGRTRSSILADCMEALIAAVFLDGGMESAREFVLGFVKKAMSDNLTNQIKDYKTLLQEIIQKNPEEIISYRLVDEVGPDHNKQFVVEVCLNGSVIGKGTGPSKKSAEQMAAREAMELMGE